MARESIFTGHRHVERAINGWVEAGLIDAATAVRLREHERAGQPPHTGRLAMVAFGFGGLLLASGLFLFVAANWQDLSPWWRFSLVIAVITVLHLGGAVGGRFSPSLATTLHGVGTAALGAGIFLAGQVFNLQAHWPQAFLLWALGAGVAALLLRDWPQTLWVAVLGPMWLTAEWVSRFPWYAGMSGSVVVYFGVVVLSVAYLAAPAPGLDVPWRRALARLGAAVLIPAASMLAVSGYAGLDLAEQEREPVPRALLWTGWSVAVVLPFALAWLMRRRQAWPVAVAAVLAGIVVLFDPGVTWQRLGIFLVCAAGSASLVAWGVMDGARLRVNIGVLAFALTVLAFYFSSLFGMLGRAFGLIGMGLLCIGGGWLAERGRRRLIERLERRAAP